MKKFIYALFLIGLLGLLIALIAIFPYVLYMKVVTEGINSSYLELKIHQKVALTSFKEYLFKQEGQFVEEKKFWQLLHFKNFLIPTPWLHPQVFYVPYLSYDDKSGADQFGARLETRDGQEFFRFSSLSSIRFEHSLDEQKIFGLPLFRNHLLKKPLAEIWEDIFTKQINLPVNMGWTIETIRASFEELAHLSFQEMIYNLYVLYMRDKLIGDRSLSLSFVKEMKKGVIEYKDITENMVNEELLILEKGVIYRLQLFTKPGSIFPESIRRRFIYNSTFKEDTPDDSIGSYNVFKELSFAEKIEQPGLIALYTAWTHVPEKKEFLQELIRYQERGSGNYRTLEPLYLFAYRKFGTNLSSQGDKRTESAEEKLKRKIEEEKEKEQLLNSKILEDMHDDDFPTPEDKVKYYLQKAKDLEINTDSEDNMITD